MGCQGASGGGFRKLQRFSGSYWNVPEHRYLTLALATPQSVVTPLFVRKIEAGQQAVEGRETKDGKECFRESMGPFMGIQGVPVNHKGVSRGSQGFQEVS